MDMLASQHSSGHLNKHADDGVINLGRRQAPYGPRVIGSG